MVIYKITNKVNQKIYIGLTRQPLKLRFRAHCFRKKTAISLAIHKYGKENFTVEVIDTASHIEELQIKERYHIAQCNSFYPNGYNLTIGGENSQITENTKNKISITLKKQNRPMNDDTKKAFNNYLKSKQQKVFQYTLDLQLVNIYSSLKEVSLIAGYSSKQLGRAIHNRTGIYKNYYWKLEKKEPRKPKPNPQRKTLYCFDLQGNRVAHYYPANSVENGYFHLSTICYAISKQKAYKGHYWSYDKNFTNRSRAAVII